MSVMNGDELSSQEAIVLRGEIQTIGTTVLRAIGEVRNSVHESLADQAELVGKVMTEVSRVGSDVREIKRMLGIEDKPSAHHASHHPRHHRHSPPPASDRPSLPPQFAEEERDIEVTDTGSYRIPPGTLDRISRKFDKMEEEKKLAEAASTAKEQLRQELAAENEKLAKRVSLVIKIGAAFAAFVGAVATTITWTIHHVH